ncbi:MAG: Lrp/AsnC family transcriptional regulator [Gammaproteobacteria bacterium]|nr:Lrp/AsnC family transcriptional regulator [Gammaproteobacteria bacterium]MDH5514287.1 Lrp/AsnC family transcriptional regulator [Gammaproteobacteria bacterium]
MKSRNNDPAILSTPVALTALEKTLLNDFQRGLPMTATPFADVAAQTGVSEEMVIDTLQSLQQRGLISRVGPVFAPRRAGASTLAALSVPEDQLDEVAGIVNEFAEVNHNYQREHDYNLWFVVTAPDQSQVDRVLAEIESATGLPVLDLPLERSFYIDLGFPLWC